MSAFNFDVNNIELGGKPIIEQCEFSVSSGDLVAFIGPSGCGKTTMLNTVAGLLSFDHIQTRQVDNLSYIFQEPRLIPWLTVSQNLTLINPDLTPERCEELLNQVELNNCADAFPNQLSGGMQKRVSIARAFARLPSLVLLDEPFSSLDKPTAKALHALLLSLLNQYQTAAVLVTHDLSEAIALADEIVFLSTQPMNIIRRYAVPLCKFERTPEFIQSVLEDLQTESPELLKGKA
ncbi:MAG: ATP-binding cassette domain-containing protein [Pseudomonadota bacterium]